ERPRLHHQWRPDAVRFDPAVDETLRRGLEALGHRLEPAPWTIGEVQVVRQRGARLEAWADSRGPGGTAVLEVVGAGGGAGSGARR
ncbi:MAG TPA: gamma-glutamyltransferase, partial [Candidatus Polarisedimenticolia bacterium]|nr:gamma-glutamyltransferase [Candidatus Polarisedimenticolia bacterium]